MTGNESVALERRGHEEEEVEVEEEDEEQQVAAINSATITTSRTTTRETLSSWNNKSEERTTLSSSRLPGAVAVSGSRPMAVEEEEEVNDEDTATQTRSYLGSGSTTLQQGNEEETFNDNRNNSPMIVLEATAVQEIYATPVLVESTTIIQQVDIDNEEDDDVEAMIGVSNNQQSSSPPLTTQSSEIKRPHYGQILRWSLLTLIVYLLILGASIWITGPDDGDDGNGMIPDKCLRSIHHSLEILQYIEGAAWAQMTLGSLMLGVYLYVGLDEIQDRFCITPDQEESPPPPKDTYWAMSILFTMNILWGLTCLASLIVLEIENLGKKASRIWSRDCTDEQLSDLLEGMDVEDQRALTVYTITMAAVVPFFVFNAIGRGRLIFSPQSCQHIRRAWKVFFVYLKVMIDLVLCAVTAFAFFGQLKPFINHLEEFLRSAMAMAG